MSERCTWSDQPPEWCAHCQGHDLSMPSIDTAPAPRRPKPVTVAASNLTTTTRRAYAPIPRGHHFPALCVHTHCRTTRTEDGTRQLDPRTTDGRANLCPTCEDRIRDNLGVIADVWPDLEAALGATETRGSNDPVKSSPTPGLVLNEAVSAAMSDADSTLAFYGRRVRDERGAAWPLGEPTVPELARWLARTHLPWLAAHPDQEVSAALADDAHRLRRAVEKAAYEAAAHRISLPFHCREEVPITDAEDSPTRSCDALMSTTLHPDADTLPDFVCEAGHRVPPSMWMQGKWQRKNGPVDAASVVELAQSVTTRVFATSTTPRTPPRVDTRPAI